MLARGEQIRGEETGGEEARGRAAALLLVPQLLPLPPAVAVVTGHQLSSS
jgi:hypothetical protein